MPKYIYKKQPDGQATDLRAEKDDYKLQADEQEIMSDTFPDIETLHSQTFKDKRDDEKKYQQNTQNYQQVIEEVIDLLIAQNVIKKSDLSQESQDILSERDMLKSKIG